MRKFGVKRASGLYWSIFLLLCIVVWLTMWTTSAKKDPQENYKIAGRGLSIPDQTLYLIDQNSTSIVDSATLVGGSFDVLIRKNKIRSRVMAIRYFDKERNAAALLNFPIGETRKVFHTWFFIEDDVTLLEEFQDPEEKGAHSGYFARVSADGHENALVQQYYKFDLSKSDSYGQRLQDYEKVIAQNADSKFLVACLLRHRADFNVVDLKDLFGKFSNDARQCFYGHILSSFLYADVHPSSLSLADLRVGLVQNADKRTMLNILAFPTSDISPLLNRHINIDSLHDVYSGNERVTFSYITMSKDPFNWKATLQYHRSSWSEFFVDRTYVDFMRVKYNFRGAPLLVFTDQYGMLLKRVEGFYYESMTNYKEYIDDVLR